MPAASGRTTENRNPADQDELIGTSPTPAAEDVEKAVAAAREAFPRWRALPAPKRGEILYRAAEILVRRKEEFSRDMTREMGKVLAETRGDVQEAIDMTYYMAGEGRRQFGQTTPSELANKFQMSVRMPVGIAGLITPWNFPMAIPSWKMMPALILGNTVVIKPAPDTPLSVVNLDQGARGGRPAAGRREHGDRRRPEVGAPLMTPQGRRHRVLHRLDRDGRKVSEACAPRSSTATWRWAARTSSWSWTTPTWTSRSTARSGAASAPPASAAPRPAAWSCTRRSTSEFAGPLRRAREGLQGRQRARRERADGPVINESAAREGRELREDRQDEGATLLTGGHRLDKGRTRRASSTSPPSSATATRRCASPARRVFGPVVSVIPVGSLDEAIEVGNAVEYGLSASIYTRDINKAFRAMRDMYTGIFYVNAPTIGAETHLPFGGTKNTGNGHREACVQALDVFSEWKSIYIDYSGTLQRAQIDNDS